MVYNSGECEIIDFLTIYFSAWGALDVGTDVI